MVDLNGTLLAQFINFFILAAVLGKFAYKPILKVMADRKNRIAADLDGAERARKAAEEMQNEYQTQLKNARAEAQVIVDKAVQQAEKETQAQLTAVREQINQEKDRARTEIANERESALREMREEVVSLSMAVAGKLLKKNMNNDLNAKLVADCIEKLDAQSVGR